MRRDYLSRLGRAARWYLPPAEAAEVLEDYREIAEGRSEEELRRDLGTPRAAMRQLAQPRAYRRWLAVFLVLVFCGAAPVLMMRNRYYWTFLVWPAQWAGLCLGVVLSALWFRRNGSREGVRPKAVLPLQALLLAGMAWAWVITGVVATESWDVLNFLAPTEERARLLHGTLRAGIGVSGLLGIFGLAGARLGDRRWLAVYTLGLTGMLLFLSARGLLTLMVAFTPEALRAFLAHQVFLTVVGLLGTGAALC